MYAFIKDFYYFLLDKLEDLLDALKYDFLRLPLPEYSLPRNIPMTFLFNEKEGHYVATSAKFPGLVTYGKDKTELWQNVNDAILTYFDIPRSVSQRIGYPYDLPLPNGQKIVQQRKAPALAQG